MPDAQSTFNWSSILDEESRYRKNLETRGYILGPLAETIAAVSEGQDHLYGEVFLRAVILAIPRFLWPGKTAYLFMDDGQTEQFIQSHFGLPLEDAASTLIWNGYAEAGVLGIFLYMGTFGILVGYLQSRAIVARSTIIGTMVLGILLAWVYRPEMSIDSIWGDLRVVFFLLVLDRFWGTKIEQLTARVEVTQGV